MRGLSTLQLVPSAMHGSVYALSVVLSALPPAFLLSAPDAGNPDKDGRGCSIERTALDPSNHSSINGAPV